MAEVELPGGIKFKGGKIFVILTALTTAGGALWGGFEFYKDYLKNGNKREAFLDAQRKIKKKYKDPIYWGAFVMLGG